MRRGRGIWGTAAALACLIVALPALAGALGPGTAAAHNQSLYSVGPRNTAVRTLDAASDSEPAGLADAVPNFDDDVRAMALRAQEVHCTEEGFNAAIVVRADELIAGGPGGELLIDIVRERGLGSLDEGNGGLIQLPTA